MLFCLITFSQTGRKHSGVLDFLRGSASKERSPKLARKFDFIDIVRYNPKLDIDSVESGVGMLLSCSLPFSSLFPIYCCYCCRHCCYCYYHHHRINRNGITYSIHLLNSRCYRKKKPIKYQSAYHLLVASITLPYLKNFLFAIYIIYMCTFVLILLVVITTFWLLCSPSGACQSG